MFCRQKGQEGVVLIFGIILLVALSATVITYVCLVGSETKHIGYQIADSQALYLAEAGIYHVLFLLKKGLDPTEIKGETVYLSPGKSYTILEIDISLGPITFIATSSSNTAGHEASNAVDKDLDTYWQSFEIPGKEWIQLEFPNPATFDRASFWAIPNQGPVKYKWQVENKIDKKGEIKWETIFSKAHNIEAEVTDIFGNFVENKMYLRLYVEEAGDDTTKTQVAVKEINLPSGGIYIESQGTLEYAGGKLTKTVSQIFFVDTKTTPITITPDVGTWKER